MKVSHLAVGLGLLCFSGLAYAADAPQQSQPVSNSDQQTTNSNDQQQPVANDTDKKEEKKICKREPMTGTLIGAKVCRTQKEWDDQARGNGAEF